MNCVYSDVFTFWLVVVERGASAKVLWKWMSSSIRDKFVKYTMIED